MSTLVTELLPYQEGSVLFISITTSTNIDAALLSTRRTATLKPFTYVFLVDISDGVTMRWSLQAGDLGQGAITCTANPGISLTYNLFFLDKETGTGLLS